MTDSILLSKKIFAINSCLGILGYFLGISSAIPNKGVLVAIILLMMVSSNYVFCLFGMYENQKWVINALMKCENEHGAFVSYERIEAANLFFNKITIIIMIYFILRNCVGVNLNFIIACAILLLIRLLSFNFILYKWDIRLFNRPCCWMFPVKGQNARFKRKSNIFLSNIYDFCVFIGINFIHFVPC